MTSSQVQVDKDTECLSVEPSLDGDNNISPKTCLIEKGCRCAIIQAVDYDGLQSSCRLGRGCPERQDSRRKATPETFMTGQILGQRQVAHNIKRTNYQALMQKIP